MSALDSVLPYRPSAVARALGEGSRLPLLAVSELVRGWSGPLVALSVEAEPVLEACFRAAREANAAVGIARAPAARNGAVRLFQETRDAAESGRHRLPFFLQAGPFALGADKDAKAAASRALVEHAEAGFTAFWLDPSGCPESDAPRIAAEIARPAVELELAVEVSVPSDPAAAARWAGAMASEGGRPTFVRARSTDFGEPVDFSLARAWADAVAGSGVIPSVALSGACRPEAIRAWVEAGFRKLEPATPIARARAERLGSLSGAEAEVARERLEAVAFCEALDLITASGGEGSGRRITTFLADQSAG